MAMKHNKRKKIASRHRRKRKNINCQKKLSKQSKLINIKKEQELVKKATLFSKLIAIISKGSGLVHFLSATFIVVIGFAFNALDEMPLFWLKALFGYVLYLILSYTTIYINRKNNKLILELTGDPQLFKCQVDYTANVDSNFNFILCFVAGIYFVAISIILGFVKINPIGIYSLFALFCVVFWAFIIFQQYIFILLLLHDISKISPGNFYELIPERTDWFKLLEKFSNNCRNIFIVLGSLFILLFIIFSPINSIQIIFHDKFSSPQFIPLLCTWIIILIAIIFMVPFTSFVRSNLLQKIYKNLISQSIENYNKKYIESENDSQIIYLDIILRLYDRKYTLQNSYTWVVPVIVSITNFASVIISIVVDLKDLASLT